MLHLVSLRNQSTVLSLPQLYRSCTENPGLDVDPGRSELAMQRSILKIPREILSEPTKPPTPFAVSKFTVIEEPVAYPLFQGQELPWPFYFSESIAQGLALRESTSSDML